MLKATFFLISLKTDKNAYVCTLFFESKNFRERLDTPPGINSESINNT